MNWKYVKPTSIEKIQAVESENNIQLPQELKDLILQYNNGRPEKSSFMVNGNERIFKKLLSYNQEDTENIYPYIDILRNINKDLFPIASDPGGNFICLSEGKIIYWEHEFQNKKIVCDSITEFIALLF